MDNCQLEQLPLAGEKLGDTELTVIKVARKARRAAEKIIHLPIVPNGFPWPRTAPPVSKEKPKRRPPLGLRPGELVRVRLFEEIRPTLDEHQRCAGLSYMPTMDRFCGKVFPVRKRIDRFFDERTRTMLHVKDVVILDDVICEAALTSNVDYGGCDRSCFLFWKEDWLERVDDRK